ncbi:MAG TPA: hypothetical protein VJM08_11120 [Anaerolineales bacterium]|nr:hypothetical protein [Anaerolineales bacterium]
MNQKTNLTITIAFILFYSLVLSSCGGGTSLVPSLVPTISQTPPHISTSVPSATIAITATPALNNKTIVITPDDVFSFPGLKALSTPGSADFCEHIPPPQTFANADQLTLLSGRFVLCPWESWPWVINTAMDLDTGSFVSRDNESADIIMQNGHVTLDGEPPPYLIHSLNNAQIDGVTTAVLSYEYCEQDLLSLLNNNIQSVLIVKNGSIACLKTTEGQIALVRVERIYPLDTTSVEFSFAILKNE